MVLRPAAATSRSCQEDDGVAAELLLLLPPTTTPAVCAAMVHLDSSGRAVFVSPRTGQTLQANEVFQTANAATTGGGTVLAVVLCLL